MLRLSYRIAKLAKSFGNGESPKLLASFATWILIGDSSLVQHDCQRLASGHAGLDAQFFSAAADEDDASVVEIFGLSEWLLGRSFGQGERHAKFIGAGNIVDAATHDATRRVNRTVLAALPGKAGAHGLTVVRFKHSSFGFR